MTKCPEKIHDLASRFRRYRDALRHAGIDSRPELRAWNGPVHKVMSELGEEIADRHCPLQQVLSLMGEPDATKSAGSHHNGEEVPSGQTHIIYWWRGGHDYLYFVVQDGVVVSARWWYAGE